MPRAPFDEPRPWSVSALRRALAGRGSALVALSGGVDSSVVAWLAHAALGPAAHAATLVGPAVSRAEVARAYAVAEWVGIPHTTVEIDPLENAAYRANPANRCYFCRQGESNALREWGSARGVRQYLDGVHVDDLGDDRPGLKALDEAGFLHPLLEAGWGKAEVRAYAREVGLPNWDEPSEACLASRIPHGRGITRALLTRVEDAEEVVRTHGFRRVRVRVEGSGARVVVDPRESARLLSEPVASAIRASLGELGFARVALDPEGYRPRANG